VGFEALRISLPEEEKSEGWELDRHTLDFMNSRNNTQQFFTGHRRACQERLHQSAMGIVVLLHCRFPSFFPPIIVISYKVGSSTFRFVIRRGGMV
jgi:hypothetical protein